MPTAVVPITRTVETDRGAFTDTWFVDADAMPTEDQIAVEFDRRSRNYVAFVDARSAGLPAPEPEPATDPDPEAGE